MKDVSKGTTYIHILNQTYQENTSLPPKNNKNQI